MNTTHEAINSFLGSAYPTFCYEIYRKDGKLYGHKIDWKHPSQVVRDYSISFDIQGRTARFVIVADDAAISRKEAIEFAVSIVKGKHRIIHTDLTHVNPTAK
jgi:hypothetical protein